MRGIRSLDTHRQKQTFRPTVKRNKCIKVTSLHLISQCASSKLVIPLFKDTARRLTSSQFSPLSAGVERLPLHYVLWEAILILLSIPLNIGNGAGWALAVYKIKCLCHLQMNDKPSDVHLTLHSKVYCSEI